MSDTVISAEGLGKRYLIGHEAERERYTTLRDVIGRTVTGLARSAGDMIRGRQLIVGDEIEEFWALRDVNFEVKRGDVVGIVGRNGAGKSTLLKILSRITEPSEGRVKIRGRVASLLEVGTGFHPELTGRENIFLNGAILGMTRSEIKKKFDEIVAFAEVEKFLDTPVKRYSSGMYVRLAFAVAAHLEPEILIVDEVLAVGDAEFQKKCLGKMSEVAGHGRTVLFVSHNLDAVQRLCSSGVFLRQGVVHDRGPIDKCITSYLGESIAIAGYRHVFENAKSDTYHVVGIDILDRACQPKNIIRTWDDVRFQLSVIAPSETNKLAAFIQISSVQGAVLMMCETAPDLGTRIVLKKGLNVIDCLIDRFPLASGQFKLSAGLTEPNVRWVARSPELTLRIHPDDIFNSGSPPSASRYFVPVAHNWQISQI